MGRKLSEYIKDLNDGTQATSEYTISDLHNTYNKFVQFGLCSSSKNDLEKMLKLRIASDNVRNNVEQIMGRFLENKALKDFLIIHSVFRIDAMYSGDMLESVMVKLLDVDNEYLSKFDKKSIASVGLSRLVDSEKFDLCKFTVFPFNIRYKMFGNYKLGESYQPIEVYDVDMDDKKLYTKKDVRELLEKAEWVDSWSRKPEVTTEFVQEDDLPF